MKKGWKTYGYPQNNNDGKQPKYKITHKHTEYQRIKRCQKDDQAHHV